MYQSSTATLPNTPAARLPALVLACSLQARIGWLPREKGCGWQQYFNYYQPACMFVSHRISGELWHEHCEPRVLLQMRASAVGIDYDAMTARAAQMLLENESKAVKRPAEDAADGEPPARAAAGAGSAPRPTAVAPCWRCTHGRGETISICNVPFASLVVSRPALHPTPCDRCILLCQAMSCCAMRQ